MSRIDAARIAKEASLQMPGWAWEKGTHRLWILGEVARKRGYTPKILEAAYRRIKATVPADDDRNFPIGRYVRIHPSLARAFVSDTDLALNIDPTAMAGARRLSVQFHTKLDKDPFRVQISHNFRHNGQNCFFFLRIGPNFLNYFVPLPRP